MRTPWRPRVSRCWAIPLRVGIFENTFWFLDATRLVSSSQDETMRLWDLETRQQIGAPIRSDGIGTATAEPQAGVVGTTTEDHILLWDFDFDSWPGAACQAAGRNMTDEEWKQFGPTSPTTPPARSGPPWG